ncbi:CPBP family intramembrane metalloprotease [halophilic archaeon]|nr:CPBP family intramembrane metalloprotease [halophilic archaeon]
MLTRHRGSSTLTPLVSALFVGFGGLVTGGVLVAAVAVGLESIGFQVFDNLALAVGVTVVMQGIGFAIVAVAYLRYHDLGVEFIRLRMPRRSDVLWIGGGLVGLFGLLTVINVLLQLVGLGNVAQHELARLGQQQPVLFLILVPLSVLIIGPGEELLFRGIIQTRLVEAYSTNIGIIVTSAIFASAHFPAYGGENVAVAIVVLFVLSIVLGWIYEKTDNLVVPVVVHGLYDAVQFFTLYILILIELSVLFH